MQCAGTLYESEIVTSILNNSKSWIGITDTIIDKLDANMMLRKNRIMLNKLTLIGKLMAK